MTLALHAADAWNVQCAANGAPHGRDANTFLLSLNVEWMELHGQELKLFFSDDSIAVLGDDLYMRAA